MKNKKKVSTKILLYFVKVQVELRNKVTEKNKQALYHFSVHILLPPFSLSLSLSLSLSVSLSLSPPSLTLPLSLHFLIFLLSSHFFSFYCFFLYSFLSLSLSLSLSLFHYFFRSCILPVPLLSLIVFLSQRKAILFLFFKTEVPCYCWSCGLF